jgi:hypothetical protein
MCSVEVSIYAERLNVPLNSEFYTICQFDAINKYNRMHGPDIV